MDCPCLCNQDPRRCTSFQEKHWGLLRGSLLGAQFRATEACPCPLPGEMGEEDAIFGLQVQVRRSPGTISTAYQIAGRAWQVPPFSLKAICTTPIGLRRLFAQRCLIGAGNTEVQGLLGNHRGARAQAVLLRCAGQGRAHLGRRPFVFPLSSEDAERGQSSTERQESFFIFFIFLTARPEPVLLFKVRPQISSSFWSAGSRRGHAGTCPRDPSRTAGGGGSIGLGPHRLAPPPPQHSSAAGTWGG